MSEEAVTIILVLCAYFLPTFVAACRKHPNGVAILLLNLLLGWTMLGWIVALIWSVLKPAQRVIVIPPAQLVPQQEEKQRKHRSFTLTR